jgi:hypothetical protein
VDVVNARLLPLVALALSGCSWELPPPNLALDTGSPVRDVPRDVVAMDAPPPPRDVVTLDHPMDAGPLRDVTDVFDAASDVPRDARPDATDGASLDITFGADITDVAIDRGPVDVPPVDTGLECTPGARRACFTGAMSTRNVGACRDGVQFCERPGMWGPTCEGEVTRDCAGRVCGSDACGGSCGTCPAGQLCDDTGTCATPVCGTANFTVPCTGGGMSWTCPTHADCGAAGTCTCMEHYLATTCSGSPCAAGCAYPNWFCAPEAPFCNRGSIRCPSGSRCPRFSTCLDGGGCRCLTGFFAKECDATLCTACPGTAWYCDSRP